jgi:hypothetical protein
MIVLASGSLPNGTAAAAQAKSGGGRRLSRSRPEFE